MNIKRLVSRHEFIIFVTIVALSALIGAVNPNFFSARNFFGLARSVTIAGIFALGVLIVLISGDIDVSFVGIAVVSMYTTIDFLAKAGYEGGMLLPFVLAALIGLVLGLINAIFIAGFKLPTLIVSIGTLSMFTGFMLFFVGSDIYNQIELWDSVSTFARSSLVTLDAGTGTASLHPSVLILLVFSIFVAVVLRYTTLGRSIYAIGGDREAAARAGFNIARTQVIIYAFVGLLSGVGGMVSGVLSRQANPFSIVGTELDVIAAVVLGGASIMGGRGSVIGTLLGVLLITMVNNSLILLGIPSEWQRFVVGILILVGTGLPLLRAELAKRRQLQTAQLTERQLAGD